LSQVQLDRRHDVEERDLLQVTNLSVAFTRSRSLFGNRMVDHYVRAVDGVSFGIMESEIVSLVGESGSGKTTLARCLMGLVPANSGSIKFSGTEVSGLRGESLRKYWRNVQMIYQDPFESLDPGQTVFSILSSPIYNLTDERNSNVIQESVIKLLEEMDLNPESVMWKFPHQLSGGQRQRINIARALAANPKLLIADEPITMLDAAQRLRILALLRRLQRTRNLSILLITHDLASAKVMSQRTLVMYLGKLVEIGPTKEIMARPNHPYVELILESTPRLARNKTSKPSDDVHLSWIEQSEKVKRGCVFEPRCKYATAICKSEDPGLLERSPSHLAACHNPLNV
jgi:peptide/nickel transport system ATP-binding protein